MIPAPLVAQSFAAAAASRRGSPLPWCVASYELGWDGGLGSRIFRIGPVQHYGASIICAPVVYG